ncbi:MAG: MFS transporter [Armatimonadota bacterium]|nr:MFS transporter [Armatimonadota bacterium]MDR5697023.1 MFS transporter [Armatimonadota bacterium]
MRFLPAIPPAARRAFLYDLGGAVLFGLFAGMVLPFLSVTARRLGATPLQVSLLTAGPAIGLLFAAWWSAIIAGRNPVPFVVWPSVVARGLFLLAPLVSGPHAFVALVIAFHLVHGTILPAYTAAIRSVFPREHRGRLLGLVRVGLSLASILAALVAGSALQRFGYPAVFPVAAVFGIASALVFGRIHLPGQPRSNERPSVHEAWRVALADSRFRALLVTTSVFGFGGWMMAPAVPLLLVDELGATNSQVGVLSAVMSACSVLSFFVWGRFIDRHSGLAAIRIVFAVGILTPLLFYLAPSTWYALLPFATDGFVIAAMDLAWMAAVMELAPADRVSQYTGAYASLLGVRGVVAPLLAGVVAEAMGPRPVFLIAASLIATAALVGWLAPRDQAR